MYRAPGSPGGAQRPLGPPQEVLGEWSTAVPGIKLSPCPLSYLLVLWPWSLLIFVLFWNHTQLCSEIIPSMIWALLYVVLGIGLGHLGQVTYSWTISLAPDSF